MVSAPTRWKISGEYFENCSCDVVCPCEVSPAGFLGAMPDNGYCNVWFVFHILDGKYGDVDVGGLNFIVAAHAPGVMGLGGWTVAAYADDRASAPQTEALAMMLTGAAGGPMSAVAPLIETNLGLKSVPIEYRNEGKKRSVRVPGILDSTIQAVPGATPEGVVMKNGANPLFPENWVQASGVKAHSRITTGIGISPASAPTTRRSPGRRSLMTTATSSAYPLSRERNLILAALLALAALAWAVLLLQSSMSDEDMAGLTMGVGAPVFVAIWVVMMVAMMFPTAAPMILTFTRVQQGKRVRQQLAVPTWIFVGAYVAVWTVFGFIAYGGAVAAEELADRSTWVTSNAARIGGCVLLIAGFYQLSPLKRTCLTKCRTPMQFIMTSWRDGYGGALRMGVEHGAYCLGCCWLLFVILFPLGIMNVAIMALITALIFAEKSVPGGQRIAMLAAVALVVYGTVVVAKPDLLPTAMSDPSASMIEME